MKKTLLCLLALFCAISLFAQQEPKLVKFYMNDGDYKSINVSDIDNIGIIPSKENYLMKIFYNDSLTAYYPTSSIDSMNFIVDMNGKENLYVFVFGIPNSYLLDDIDSISFSILEMKIADDVIVIDSSGKNDISSLDSVNVNFKTNSNIGKSINIGDIIASEPTELAPNGFLKRIKSIKTEGDSIVVETEDAKLTDVIGNGIISFKRKFSPSDTGMTSIKISKEKILENEGFTVGFKDVVIYDYDGNKQTENDQIKIDGTNTFYPELGFNVVIEDWKVKQIIVQLSVVDKLSLEAHANLEYNTKLKKSLNDLLGIPPIHLPPITVFIFGIPVVVTSNIDVQVGCNLSLGAEVKSSIAIEASALSGIAYNSGSWNRISNLSSSFGFEPPTLSLGGNIKSYVGPQINVSFYGRQDAFYAYSNVLGFAELNVDLLNKPLWQLWGGIEANAGLESPWFDLHKELPLVLEYRKLLAQANDLISDINPKEAKSRDTITISGYGFGAVQGGSFVGFKTRKSMLDIYQATVYPKWSDEEIQVIIPDGLSAGSIKIAVKIDGLWSNLVDYSLTESKSPYIISILPDSAAIGEAVLISGKNFGSSRDLSFVSFNNILVSDYLSWNDNGALVKVPDKATSGKVSVTVKDEKSNEVNFYLLHSPKINSINPDSAIIGDIVTITGEYFGSSKDTNFVSFNDVKAIKYTLWNDNRIQVLVPVGATNGKVSVTVRNLKSNEVKFKVMPADPGVYDAVTIGTQTWMLKNLDVDRYRNGDPIRHCQSVAEWVDADNKKEGAWCYYNNDPAIGAAYGKLYNWYAVDDARGLAPRGWHVPNDAEWMILINGFGGEYMAGGKLKEAGLAHWASPNWKATNESGFTGLPGGYRFNENIEGRDFEGITRYGRFYSTTDSIGEWNEKLAEHFWLHSEQACLWIGPGFKGFGLSVRCIKDQ